jgi:hypothetical protein
LASFPPAALLLLAQEMAHKFTVYTTLPTKKTTKAAQAGKFTRCAGVPVAVEYTDFPRIESIHPGIGQTLA